MRALARYSAVLSVVALVLALAATAAKADVVAIRDPAFGLPHICADTDAEAARQQGYEAARDRFAQFLLVMNTARGTLAGHLALLGVDPADDIVTRVQGYSRSELNLMFQRMSPSEQAVLVAYCEGVNKALSDMLASVLPQPLELKFFKIAQNGGVNNLFGTKNELTQGEGADPYYQNIGAPGYIAGGFQFTPELAMAFAVLQIRNFGFEGWDELGMAEALSKLVTTYGNTVGTELWDDRYWMNDPLQPVSVPDPTAPGFGGPLARLTLEDKKDLAKAVDEAADAALGRARLPGYPMRDYSKALDGYRERARHREATAKKWGAWPALGSYAWMVAPDRSATSNPWIGGFPQTGIQTPSIMHYTEIHGDTIQGNGMVFVGGPYVLIGHTDNVAFTTTTAHLKVIDQYIEELVNGDFNIFNYDHHGTIEAMEKRIELVEVQSAGAMQVPVFRTDKKCSANGCTKGDRPVLAWSGDVAGDVSSATGTSITDTGATLTAAAYVGGHLAIVAGAGAGQMRAISGNTNDTISVGVAFATTPDSTSEYVAVLPGNVVTAVSMESVIWLGEGAAAAGFSRYQKTQDVLDVREAVRSIVSTHNFFAADNVAYNGIGTDHGNGNIYYATSGFKRVRQSGPDPRLPVDGTAPDTFAVRSGAVDGAGGSSLTDTGAAYTPGEFDSAAINFTYDNSGDNGSEFVVAITAGNGYKQVRRITSNTADTLTLEHPWGVIPSPGDAYEIYEIWATPEAMNPAEGFTANWNNKQAKANEIMLSQNGRNHRVELILEQLKDMNAVTRDQLRDLNKYVAGIVEPGTPARYLVSRLQAALTAHGDCGTIDDQIIAETMTPDKGREFINPLVNAPAGTAVANSAASGVADYVKGWATELAADIYGDEYDPAAVSKLNDNQAIGWILHAIDAAEGDVTGSYANVYSGDYFNGADWKQVVHDSFCDYVAAHTTISDKTRRMSQYNHPLAALPCTLSCATPISFDPTPYGNRGTWEQVVEVGSTVKGEFMFPLGQSGHIDGSAAFGQGNDVHQTYHTSSLHPLWRDWRFVPMLDVCDDVTLGGDEDGDTDGDGVLDGFEQWYYPDLTNTDTSDTDGDGADLATEYRWGSDPTLSDTDGDTIPDGSDVAPQDRVCIQGTLKKLSVKDSTTAGKDKITGKWSVPLNVCMGGDNATACTTNTDCGNVGICKRIFVNPTKDSLRIVVADDSQLFDAEIPIAKLLWKNKNDEKFSYQDKDAVNGPVSKIKVQVSETKGTLSVQFSAKDFDIVAGDPFAADGVVGMTIGGRCLEEVTANCKTGTGKLSCKE